VLQSYRLPTAILEDAERDGETNEMKFDVVATTILSIHTLFMFLLVPFFYFTAPMMLEPVPLKAEPRVVWRWY
jgi:hypothetical protein